MIRATSYESMFHPLLTVPPETFRLPKIHLVRIARAVCEVVPRVSQGIVTIAFVSDETMQQYNLRYRKRDATTDVLSFAYHGDYSPLKSTDVAGDILLSESVITQQAYERGHRPYDETIRLFVHALLHLLGYDHEIADNQAVMSSLERIVVERLSESYHISLPDTIWQNEMV